MATHLEERLQRDFDQIRASITEMARIAVGMLRDCVTAFEQGNRQLASVVILRDQRMDLMEKDTDRLCLEFIIRHQPAGSHLRFVYAALQINFELERIGDYAESIARQTARLIDLKCNLPTTLFRDITEASISMFQNAINAFIRQDANLAEVTEQIEERVDVLRNQVNSELTHLVQNGQLPLAALSPLMTIARRFERVSDQAKSICQETLYTCTGEYAKHRGAHLYRVLCVDDGHGCLSRIAAAVGQELHRTEFEFTSAGLDPRPLQPQEADLLRAQGIDVTAPQGVANLERFQVVIALSERAAKQLPPPAAKAMHVHWTAADPCARDTDARESESRLKDAREYLTKEISNLVRSILGEEPDKPLGV